MTLVPTFGARVSSLSFWANALHAVGLRDKHVTSEALALFDACSGVTVTKTIKIVSPCNPAPKKPGMSQLVLPCCASVTALASPTASGV